jgi:RNA polymerase sigma factor (sigma-70 family)
MSYVDYSNDILQAYFKDVRRVYDKNGEEYDITFCSDNKEKLIEMNLKSVISIAKKYTNLGLSIEDLIGAGNMGLCIAVDRYKLNKNELRDVFIESVEKLEDPVRYDVLCNIFMDLYTYGKPLVAFNKRFKEDNTYHKSEILKWANKNLKDAKFNSVANMWIRAYITNALNTQSRLIRKSLSDIKKEKEEGRDVIIDINQPYNDSNNITYIETIDIDDSTPDSIVVEETHRMFNDTISLLMDGLHMRERRIICCRYGLGLPRPLKPQEIAEREGIGVSRVSQIIQQSLDKMKDNYKNKYYDKIDPEQLYDLIGQCGNFF